MPSIGSTEAMAQKADDSGLMFDPALSPLPMETEDLQGGPAGMAGARQAEDAQQEADDEIVYERMSNRPRMPRRLKYHMFPLRFFLRKSPNEVPALSRVRVLWDAPNISAKGTPAMPMVAGATLRHNCRLCHQPTPMQLDYCEKYSSLYEFTANPFSFPFTPSPTNASVSEPQNMNVVGEPRAAEMPSNQPDMWNFWGGQEAEKDTTSTAMANPEYSPFTTCSSYLFGSGDIVMDENDLVNGQLACELATRSSPSMFCTPLAAGGVVPQPQIVMT